MRRRKQEARDAIARAERLFQQLAAKVPVIAVREIERIHENGGPDARDMEAAQAIANRLINAGTLFVLGLGKPSAVNALPAELARVAAVLSFLPGGTRILNATYVTNIDKER